MVGAAIRSLRASAGLNQRELADAVGISGSMLSLIESDKREPTIRFLRDVARVLGIPAAALLVAALTDEPDASQSLPTLETEKIRALADQLLSAAQQSILLRRLQSAREKRSA
jgi:XRE family transcriptional regulator, fatty acid utilization regulator